MKIRNILFIVLILLLKQNQVVSQTNNINDFKIGIYEPQYMTNINPYQCCDTNFVVITKKDTIVNGQTYPTSQLNVLSEDGFNIINDGSPDVYISRPLFMRSVLQLMKNNNMQYIPDMRFYYRPDTLFYYHGVDSTEHDTNIYNFNPPSPSNCVARPNLDSLMKTVYSDPNYKDVIWGYYITEEASYQHAFNYTDSFDPDWLHGDLITQTEVPPKMVSAAIGHFRSLKNSLGLNNHKLIACEANHGRAIFDSIVECNYIDQNNHNLGCQPWMYIYPPIMGNNMPDVFFEGSYFPFRKDWYELPYSNNYEKLCTAHYLGDFRTIDWAYTHVNTVHDLIDICSKIDTTHVNINGNIRIDTNFSWKYNYHSDTTIHNANWLWFQTYTTIIHGSKGIWFWWLIDTWQYNEVINNSGVNRFKRDYFSANYKDFISPLARQLRYLVNKNILSTDPSTIIATKKDTIDFYSIVQPYGIEQSQYPTNLSNDGLNEFLNDHTKLIGSNSYVNDHYNLRYTIRSNGDETAMIVTNPLGCSVKTNLDFRGITKNDIIRNAKKYSILFEKSFPSFDSVNSIFYKIKRDTVNLKTMQLPSSIKYTNYFDTAIYNVAFGPVDSHIIQFGPIDNQWFDELRDKTDMSYNNIKVKSEIKTDMKGNTYYVTLNGTINAIYKNSNGQWQVDWLNGDAPKILKSTGFAIDDSSSSIYYVSSENPRLYCLYYDDGWHYYQIDDHNVLVSNDSRVIYSKGQIFCVRTDGRITATNKYDRNTVILNSNAQKVKVGIGITINSEGNKIFYQGENGYIYQIELDNNNLIQALYTQNVPIRANSELHYSCGSILFVRATDNLLHALWQDENAQWHIDWLSADAKVKEGSDFAVSSYEWKSDIYYIGMDNFLYKFDINNNIVKISPTNLVNGRDSVDVCYSNGKIYYGGNDSKIHTLYYRNDYYNGLDLYMQDTPADLGNEPNTNSECFYISDDIWVRNQDDGITNQETENPIYNSNGHSYVYVYVKVRNKSSEPSTGTEHLKLYWAKAGVSSPWPNSWNGSITNPVILGNMIASNIIPIIDANGETILKFEWQVPNPDEYSSYSDKWHFCLLARIESDEDTMTYKEISDLNANVVNNNNIVLKNISIVTDGETASISIINNFSNRRNFFLKFNNPKTEYSPFITKQTEVLVHLSNKLFEEFLANLSTAMNLKVYNLKTNTFILTGDSATINIGLNPEELNMLTMEFRFLTQKVESKSKFKFNVSMTDLDNKIIGGEQFIINKSNRNLFKADAGEDKVIVKGSSASLSASSIGETATFSWNANGEDTIIEGQSVEVTPAKTKSYTLAVVAEDGFTDYDNVNVVVKEFYIDNIQPNPASNIVTVKYEASTATSAVLELTNSIGFVINTYTINPLQKEYSFNVSSLPTGSYTIILTCDNVRKDAKTLIVN
jgi:hypothetical protein